MNKFVLIATTGLLCMATAGISVANEDRPSPPSFSDLDVNGDGELSKDEISDRHLLRMFDESDADGSGTLTEDEMPEPPQGPPGGGQGGGGRGGQSQDW